MEKILTTKPQKLKKETLDSSLSKPSEQYITLDEYVQSNRETNQGQKPVFKKKIRLNVAGFSDAVKDPVKTHTKSTDSLHMFSTTQSLGPPQYSLDGTGNKSTQYQITKNNMTGGYIVYLPKLSEKEKFRAENSYSEEIKKIDRKIKRLTNELIDYYIEKKRKARTERKSNKQEEDKIPSERQKNFEFLTNVPNISEIKGENLRDSAEIENNIDQVLEMSGEKETANNKNVQIQTDSAQVQKRQKKLPILLTKRMIEQMQFRDLVISTKHNSIPKFGKVEDRREHLIRVLSKENTKLAPEELKPSHQIKRPPYYDVFDSYLKHAKPLFGEDKRVFPDPLNKNYL